MDLGNEQIVKIGGGAVVATLAGYLIWRRLRKPTRKAFPRDTVIHHQIGRGPFAPSLTPFAVKLETYLRMANIPYQDLTQTEFDSLPDLFTGYVVDAACGEDRAYSFAALYDAPVFVELHTNVHDRKMSKKDKYTWIEYNGEEIADSEFCIEYLNKKLDIDLNKNLTSREKGIARAFQKMIEENTYWTIVLDRWVYDENRSAYKVLKVPFLVVLLSQRFVRKSTYEAGIGRHTQDEVLHIMDQDLKALSDQMGKNKYLFGDTPCQEDCAIFGMLSQFYWHSFGGTAEATLKKYPNLCDYCDRMKEKYWPDWDQCITKGGTQKATK